jgi:hypothetical protein
MLRSASVRLRPVGSAAAVVGLVLTASGAWAALGGRASLPSDVPRGQLAAGAVAFVAYGAVAASASLLAMDADRHALTLWQLVPGALRRVAAARAAQGAVLASAVAAPAVVASGWLLGLTAGELVVCAAAAATMAVVGPVLDLLGSLRWPQVDWVEASEIGTSHPARYAIGFAVGIPVVGVVAALGQSTAGAGRGLLLLAAAGLAAAAPLLAAALMRVALLLCGRQIHA